MGWRDEMDFQKWLAEHFDLSDDATRPNKALEAQLRSAYEQGYTDGFKAGPRYDPKWDSD